MAAPLVLVLLLYMSFRKCSMHTKRTVVFTIALINTLQHLLKIYIYPQYAGESFGGRSTAYNMCAFLILATPIVLLIGSQLWQNFFFYIGSIAGYASICVTYWLGEPLEEQLRFVICHGLLFVSSILPGMFGLYKINWRKCWKLPFVFYGVLLILLVNDMIVYLFEHPEVPRTVGLLEELNKLNPCWAMGPPVNYPFVEALVAPFTPSIFLSSKGGVTTPILWFAIPLFILITVVGFLLGVILDNKNFKKDMKLLKEKLSHKKYKKEVYLISGKPIGKSKNDNNDN